MYNIVNRGGSSMKNKFFLFLAVIFVGMGFLTAVIPLIPSTPFVFLAGYFGTKGSPKFQKKFLSSKLYKNNLKSFQENKSLSVESKKKILIIASISIILFMIITQSIIVRFILLIVILLKYYVFLFIIPNTIENPNI